MNEDRDARVVSRETNALLQRHLQLLRQWQPRINLVAASTLDDAWQRHVVDSAQLLDHIPTDAQNIVDIGSGAGFPGLVLAILGAPGVTLIEADKRKAAFLREAARAVGCTDVQVLAGRVEDAQVRADVVTARALAPLPQLLSWSAPLLNENGTCIFLKGRNHGRELTDARKIWNMRVTLHPSCTSPESRIMKIDEIRHVHPI